LKLKEGKLLTARKVSTRKVSFAASLIALGVVLATFLWFPFLWTKCYPGQHLVNAIAGVLLGPVWAAFIATCIGIIRNALGIGTVYAFPGGIPGGVVVGVFYWLFKKLNFKYPEVAALTEPIGTVFIGGTISVYIVAAIMGHESMVGALLPIWFAFGASCVPGCIMGFVILGLLRKLGYTRERFTS